MATANDDQTDELGRLSYTASLITQGKERLYTLSLPSDVLAETCFVEPRDESPIEGFQRALNEKRARDIAEYIDSGSGTIPSSVVLSAQEVAEAKYDGRKRTISFVKNPKSFMILDGQHRVYGFHLAQSKLRVPVVIYMGLSRSQECRMFMDINTKQKPVPNELLLDIKNLGETEGQSEALFREVFDLFSEAQGSPLLGKMSPFERRKGKISRVTFNNAMKSIVGTFEGASIEETYSVLSAFVATLTAGLREAGHEDKITNPTLFRAFFAIFPSVAERVQAKHGEFSVDNFTKVLRPIFQKTKSHTFDRPGSNIQKLVSKFEENMKSSFTIARQ